MYQLGKDIAVPFKKNLDMGQVFLKYDQDSDTIYYLADLPTKSQRTRKQNAPKEQNKE